MTAVTLAVFLLGLAIIVTASAFVAAPLFSRPAPWAPAADAGEHERWERQKREALVAIREAELDHRMGKLSAEDLAAMRTRFENQALEALSALERLETTKEAR
jgi:hypothetical protein